MRLNIYQKLCLAFFIVIVIFWAGLYFTNIRAGSLNYFYSFLFGLIPLVGGFVSMVNSKVWGRFKSAIGKAVFFVGLGLFLWGMGEMVWSYYNFFLNVAAPYPSLADFGFAPSIFFYGLGAVFLSKATGAKYGWRNKHAKLITGATIVALLGISYYVLVSVARGGVLTSSDGVNLKTVLDVAYPFGDFLSLTLAVVISGLSFKYFGGHYLFNIVSFLLGLSVMFFADSIFSYTTTMGTYYNADFGDLLLATGMFLLTFGILGFNKIIVDT